jgi:transcriptional/translational regulatory protein YebC/TACO1
VVNLGADGFEVRTRPSDLHQVADALEKRLELGQRKLQYLPKDTVKLQDPDKARALLQLIDALEELDDVQNVHANFELEDALMDQLQG